MKGTGSAKRRGICHDLVAQLYCDGCYPRRILTTAANVLLLIKLVADVIMLPVGWVFISHLSTTWSPSVTYYSLVFAVLNDCNLAVIRVTSKHDRNTMPFSFMCGLLLAEIVLYLYNIMFFLTGTSMSWVNGALVGLSVLHIGYRIVLILHCRGCGKRKSDVRVLEPNIRPTPVSSDTTETESRQSGNIKHRSLTGHGKRCVSTAEKIIDGPKSNSPGSGKLSQVAKESGGSAEPSKRTDVQESAKLA